MRADEFVRSMTGDVASERRRAIEASMDVDEYREVIRSHPELAIWVVRNKNVPLEILEMLARDEDESIRAEVAGKRKLSAGLFECLATDPSALVRVSILNNAKVPTDVLARLACDSDPFVAARARERLERRG